MNIKNFQNVLSDDGQNTWQPAGSILAFWRDRTGQEKFNQVHSPLVVLQQRPLFINVNCDPITV
jgi:hypothetical protein